MAPDPSVEESQIVESLHRPQESYYSDDVDHISDFSGIDDHDAQGVADDQLMEMRSGNLKHGVGLKGIAQKASNAIGTISLQRQHNPAPIPNMLNRQDSQQDSMRSFVAETQYAAIEIDTQATESLEQPVNSHSFSLAATNLNNVRLVNGFNGMDASSVPIQKPPSPTASPFAFARAKPQNPKALTAPTTFPQSSASNTGNRGQISEPPTRAQISKLQAPSKKNLGSSSAEITRPGPVLIAQAPPMNERIHPFKSHPHQAISKDMPREDISCQIVPPERLIELPLQEKQQHLQAQKLQTLSHEESTKRAGNPSALKDPVAQERHNPRGPKSRQRSFKNRLIGSNRKPGNMPFPDVHARAKHSNTSASSEISAALNSCQDRNQVPQDSRRQSVLDSHGTLQANEHHPQLEQAVIAVDDTTMEETPAEDDINTDENDNAPINIGQTDHPAYPRRPCVEDRPINTGQQDGQPIHQSTSTFKSQSGNLEVRRHAQQIAPQVVKPMVESEMASSRPRPQGADGRPQSRHTMNRPVRTHDLEIQVETESPSAVRHKSKIVKANTMQVRSQQPNTSKSDLMAVVKSITTIGEENDTLLEVNQQREVENSELKEMLKTKESELSDVCAENKLLEEENEAMSGKLQYLDKLSSVYREHANEIVTCQKHLKSKSDEMRKSMEVLTESASRQSVTEHAAEESARRDVQIKKLGKLLESIKMAQKAETERNSELFQTKEQMKGLTQTNDTLKNDLNRRIEELQRERHNNEQLQKQIDSNGDRHKELLEILQKLPVNYIEEICKDGGMLKQVLDAGTETGVKLETLSKTVTDAANRMPEMPETLSKILGEFSLTLQTKLEGIGNKEEPFLKSIPKLFEDLNGRLTQSCQEQEEKTQLNNQLSEQRELNATLKANLESKSSEFESNATRLKELTQELTDVRTQLMNKTDQLTATIAQPREDPEMKRKVDELTTETSKLQNLLSTANNDIRQYKDSLQLCQESASVQQKQLTETEAKLRRAETTLQELEVNSRKFQVDCKNATEKVRQETTKIAITQKKELIAKHDAEVEELKQEHAKTEDSLKTACEEAESSKKENTSQAKAIARLEADLVACRRQIQQQEQQVQDLDRRATLPSLPVLETQELTSLRQALTEQQSSLKALQEMTSLEPSDFLAVRNELSEKLKEICDTRQEDEHLQQKLEELKEETERVKHENEQLKYETEQLRKRMANLETSSQNRHGSQQMFSTHQASKDHYFKSNQDGTPRQHITNLQLQTPDAGRKQSMRNSGAHQPSSRQQPTSERVGFRDGRTLAKSSIGIDASSGRSPMPIDGFDRTPKDPNLIPFSSMTSSSPLSNIEEDVMKEIASANSQSELDQIYPGKGHRSTNNMTRHDVGTSEVDYSSHGNSQFSRHIALNPRAKEMSVSDRQSVITTNRMNGPSHAEESLRRRTSRPLKPALKKSAPAERPQAQTNLPVTRMASALMQKPASQSSREGNAGSSTMNRSGPSGYNRIASGNPNSLHAKQTDPQGQVKSERMLPPQAPILKRQGPIKRKMSTSALAVEQGRSAKAPRISIPPQTNRTVIPESQERF